MKSQLPLSTAQQLGSLIQSHDLYAARHLKSDIGHVKFEIVGHHA